ncbi:rho guanine nucleotide exchange factor at 64C isoform X2 [Lasioglossum baleicum]|uniref:rho guanine nucleotide exchange factor at 64C isoform X2 n=1 Tax=Lasioglossum baleicum TaxID=434251 RepID=UPI003FCD72DC
MTMSVAVAPGSLGAPPSMLTPNMYHLQQGLNPTSASPTSEKSYDTLSKGKKSWSVRLGLSRQSQSTDDPGKGWGTISGGSRFSRQMIYGDPWLYGTVRSSRAGHEPRGFVTPPPPPPGAPILIVCSCPEFLSGTTRKFGNCRKCGGHRLTGLPLGGTCRLPQISSRSRPSLAGVLRPSIDDPYDQMRRSRLVEPRTRARSISPHRPLSQRDVRSQSVARNAKERKSSVESTCSKSEWFDKESGTGSYEEPSRKLRPKYNVMSRRDEWLAEEPPPLPMTTTTTTPTVTPSASPSPSPTTLRNRSCSMTTGGVRLGRVPKKIRETRNDWSDTAKSQEPPGQAKASQDEWKERPSSSSSDSRRSILECDVNPYLLLKKQKDEDDLSDDLSDNALEQDDARPLSSLFDSSKVKSIERIPNRSSVAEIGGQRIRVFNESREISDEEDVLPVTRIPIPKVSPKRPPRRLKEAKQTLKSILKRGKALETRRKNVLFNVDNVIFAPEKPSEATRLSWSRLGRIATCVSNVEEPNDDESEEEDDEHEQEPEQEQQQQQQEEKTPAATNLEQKEKYNFITVPNIRDPKIDRVRLKERKVSPDTCQMYPLRSEGNANRMNKFVPPVSNVERTPPSRKKGNVDASRKIEDTRENNSSQTIHRPSNLRTTKPHDEQSNRIKEEDRIVVDEAERSRSEEPKDQLPGIAVDEKDLILKSEENLKRSYLSRSQSERSHNRPEVSAGNVLFLDTMRLSLSRKMKEPPSTLASSEQTLQREDSSESLCRITEAESEQRLPAAKDVEQVPEATEKTENTITVVETEIEAAKDAPSNIDSKNVQFRRMRPTSWSPPPGKLKYYRAIDDSDAKPKEVGHSWSERSSPTLKTTWKRSNSYGSSKIEIGSPATEKNVYKITVSPRASPLVHRLQIGPGSKGARRTSILINGDPTPTAETTSDNKVTISVGGEDSVYNPTVISVNLENPPKIKSSAENRTLVILDNYKSNIVVGTTKEDSMSAKADFESAKEDESSRESSRALPSVPDVSTVSTVCTDTEKQTKLNIDAGKLATLGPENTAKLPATPDNRLERTEKKNHIRKEEDASSSKLSGLSKEALISKLLEDSLRKARENGEILDESSGEAILKILKQSLLKSNEYESSESTLEANYSRASSLNSDGDFISTNLFLEENPYEVIKEPIYEEIPDEPPPLPLSPPPTEDYMKDRIYFGDIADYYTTAKGSSEQFLRSYLVDDLYKKPNSEELVERETYLSKSPESFFKKMSISPEEEQISSKFELLNFLMDSKDRAISIEGEDDEDDEDEDEEDTEGDLEALYEQKETSLGDLSSKSSQISNVSDSSEECNIILTSSSETSKTRAVDIERTDSGVGSESSQASSTRGVPRRWRAGNVSSGPGSLFGEIPQVISGDSKLCEDCEQRLDPLITERKCAKKRVERKEIITEIVETEQKYGRDLQIILEEFHRPMFRAGLLTSEQLTAIFLNVEELLEHNLVLAEKLKDAVELAQESGDEDLLTVDVGKIFLESERMLHAFESYCTRQGSASLLLQNLEKEKELLRIFLRVSQMENTVLRRMNLNSFLMVPVQRVTKYPLLLARLLKATPSVRPDIQEAKERLKQAQANIELHLEHMNAEAKDVTSTKLWRRISIIQNGRRLIGEQDMVNIKLRKMAVEVLEWAHEEARFVLEGRLLVAQPTDNNWRRGRTVKLAPVTAMLVTNGKPNTEDVEFNDDSLFPRYIGIKEATLLLVKEKFGRYSLLREPLYLDKCIVCCETDLEDYFEVQELYSKETFIFKAEDGARTKRWCRTLQAHAQSLGAWRKRRGALPNIMICGVVRN